MKGLYRVSSTKTLVDLIEHFDQALKPGQRIDVDTWYLRRALSEAEPGEAERLAFILAGKWPPDDPIPLLDRMLKARGMKIHWGVTAFDRATLEKESAPPAGGARDPNEDRGGGA